MELPPSGGVTAREGRPGAEAPEGLTEDRTAEPRPSAAPMAARGARMAQPVTMPPIRPSCWMAAMPGLPARMPVMTLPAWSTAQDHEELGHAVEDGDAQALAGEKDQVGADDDGDDDKHDAGDIPHKVVHFPDVEVLTDLLEVVIALFPGDVALADGVEAAIHVIAAVGGKPFNPLEKPDADITLPAEERGVGGLGILLAKKNMDAVTYSCEDGKNILTIPKKL